MTSQEYKRRMMMSTIIIIIASIIGGVTVGFVSGMYTAKKYEIFKKR